MDDHMDEQKQKNNLLLVKFLTSVFEQDFQVFLSR